MKIGYQVFFLLALTIASTYADGNILLSETQLKLTSSVSSISAAKFQEHPDLYDAVGAHAQSSFYTAFIKTAKADLVYSGYEGFYTPYPETYPSGIFYNVSAKGELTEVSRIHVPVGTGQTNAIIAPTPSKNFIIRSPNMPAGTGNSFTPHHYPLVLHNYSATGVINQTANFQMDMSVLHPNFYNASLAYNGLCGVSTDGEYAMVTYAIGGKTLGSITGQKHHIIKIESNNSALTPRASSDTHNTGIPRLYSFAQKGVMFQMPLQPHKYLYVVAENSWNLTYPIGLIGNVVSYIFDSRAGTLVEVDSVPTAQYIQGIDVDTKNLIVYVNTVEASSGLSVRQFPRTPYPNNADNQNNQLLVLRIAPFTGKLTGKGGLNYNGDGYQVHSSPDGKYLAMTFANINGNDIYYHNYSGLGNIARMYSPSTLVLYRVYNNIFTGDVKLKLLDISSASPLSFGLAFDSKSERLAVAGQATYRNMGGAFVSGQKDIQLYDIVEKGIFELLV